MPTVCGYARRSKGEPITQRAMLLDAGINPQNIYQDAASSGVTCVRTAR